MMVRFKGIQTSKALFISFEKHLPLKGVRSHLAKEKIKKFLIEKEHQVMSPIIFIPEATLQTISQKTKIKPFEYQIDFSDIFKSSFNILKERLLKELTK